VLADALANLAAHVLFRLAEFIDVVRFLPGGGAHDSTFGLGWRAATAVIAPNAAPLRRRVADGRYAAEVLPTLHFDDDRIPDVW
jgi:hypothetical protein